MTTADKYFLFSVVVTAPHVPSWGAAILSGVAIVVGICFLVRE